MQGGRKPKGNPDYLLAADKQLQFARRQLTHRHNSLLGGLGMAKAAMRGIIAASSTSPHAKHMAQQIEALLSPLDEDIRANRTLPGDPM